MRIKSSHILVLAIVCIAWAGAMMAFGAETASVIPVQPVKKDVDLVICLDTSNSMDGLIDSAKQKLWAIVNELATAKPRPNLRVALYHYGNDGLKSETGWVEQLCPLTDNLDEVNEKLFKLKTRGGTEFVARVIRAATNDLKWSEQKNALKLMVVAGNEPATQDEAKYKLQEVCKASVSKGIIINTIFCGSEAEGKNSGWSDAAQWADGQFAAIDQDTGTVVVATPYDKKLLELNEKLNKTYVAYGGKKGQASRAKQAEVDQLNVQVGAPAAAERVAAKSSVLYRNAGWDVVDAVQENKLDLKTAKPETLPVEMQKMTPKEREEYVKKLTADRVAVQKEIQELSVKRDAYQKAEMEKQGLDESKSFDANLRKAIRAQGEKQGMTFEKK